MWQYFPALNDVGCPGCKMLWFPLNGFYKQLQTCLSFPTAPFIDATLRPAVIPLLIGTGLSGSEKRTKHPIYWSRHHRRHFPLPSVSLSFPSLYTSFAAMQQKVYLIQAFPHLWWEFRDTLGRGGAYKSQEMHKLSCCWGRHMY